MKSVLLTMLFFIVVVGGGSYLVYQKYGLLFAKSIDGQIVALETIQNFERRHPDDSGYAVGVQNAAGEIFAAKSLGEEWRIAHKGQCIRAKFFPYPPWDLQNRGTYWGVRVLNLKNCEANTETSPAPETSKNVLGP